MTVLQSAERIFSPAVGKPPKKESKNFATATR